MDGRGRTAFVVWLDALSEGSAGAPEYRGRVEHLASSTRAAFASKEELLAFIERTLLVRGTDEPSNRI